MLGRRRPVLAAPVDQVGGRLGVIPSHQTSPSSVSAQLVKMVLAATVAIAFGLVPGLVPGATPKKPASG
jgi:hypothetical protein